MPLLTRRWLSVVAAALALFGCVALAGVAGWFRAPESADQAQARWQARSFANYRMVLEDGACQMDYEVRNERVAWGYELTCGRGNARTVSNLFEYIRTQQHSAPACMVARCLCRKSTTLEVRYHARLGYPTRIAVTTSAWPNWSRAEFWQYLLSRAHNPCGMPSSRVISVVNLLPRRR